MSIRAGDTQILLTKIAQPQPWESILRSIYFTGE